MMRRMRIVVMAIVLFACAGAAQAGELVVNGGFETGSFGTAWVHGAYRGSTTTSTIADHAVVPDLPYAGNYSALLGFKYATQTTGAHGWMYQQVAIPSGVSSAVLNFKLRMQGYDSDYYDPFTAQIRNTSNTVLRTVLSYAFSEYNNIYKDSGWLSDDNVLPVSHDVSAFAGQTVRLYFDQANLYDALYETWTYVDDVSLVYRMWADLAVDGNGNDVFGALGSGNGGQSSRSAVAGDTLTYDLVIENESNATDTYGLTASLPAGLTAWLVVGGTNQAFPYTMPSLAPGASVTYKVKVRVAPGTSAGTYDAIVNAQSTTQSSRVDSARLRALVTAANHGLDVTIDGNGVGVIGDNGAGGFGLKTSTWGTQITYAVVVTNTGNAASTYTIAFTSDAGLSTSVLYNSTSYTTSFTTASVPAGGTASMTLRMTVPSPNPGSDYNVVLSATSVADGNKRDSVRGVLRLLAPKVDMIIATSGDNIYGASGTGDGGGSSNAGEPANTVSFPIIVQNESAVADSFTLGWTAPASGWTATITINGTNRSFPTTTPTIAANAQAMYTLNVLIPAGAAYGTYRSVLDAASRVSSLITESVAATVSVGSVSEMDMLVDGDGAHIYGPVSTGLGGTSIRTVSPGTTTTFSVQVQNVSGTNGFDISWAAPAGWTVTFNGSSTPLTNLAAGTYTLSVTVPSGAAGGTFNVIVDGRKTSKPFVMDSITARLVVVPPPIVDALIDNNGDNVYGALGTGAGGSSLQTTSAPRTLNFTVELKNRGPAADTYRVQWSPIAGWTANFQGSASPYTTGSIPAGGSRLYTFTVNVPVGAAVGNYQYILDVTSLANPDFESVAAQVHVVGPARPDYTIDGAGTGVFGLAGTGQGGTSLRYAAAGSNYTAQLILRNAGSYPDSFRVHWTVPAGWPAGSIAIRDSLAVHTTPFWSRVLNPGQAKNYTVQVQVPAGASASHTALIESHASIPPNLAESVRLVTDVRAMVRGTVFDDRNHDGIYNAGDIALAGALVRDSASGIAATTLGDGSYLLMVPPGVRAVVEQTPAGYASLSPDSVVTAALAAGGTATVDFAEVGVLTLGGGGVASGPAGGVADFAHRLQAGTAGHVTITASVHPAVTSVWFVDVNADGVMNAGDRPLLASDGDLDPAAPGAGVLHLILRVFIPAGATLAPVEITVLASQTVTATPLVLTAGCADVVQITAAGSGQLTIQKTLDRTSAAPGEIVTYSVRLFNAGADSLGNVTVLDPVSPWVDLEAGAFGAGRDMEWQPPLGSPVYLTFDGGDADECQYDAGARILQLVLSRNSAFYLAPGQAGTLVYRVRIR
jgi:uncharacterized repeat protein (TIGR01451 family)